MIARFSLSGVAWSAAMRAAAAARVSRLDPPEDGHGTALR